MNNFFDILISNKGYQSHGELAKAMGKSPNNFTNSLKYLRKNNNYTTKFAHELCEHLSISQQELRQIFDKDKRKEDDSHWSTNIVEELINIPFSILSSAVGNSFTKDKEPPLLIKLITSLSTGSTYLLASPSKPLEFTDSRLQMMIVAAILRGAKFRYIFPKIGEIRNGVLEAGYGNPNTVLFMEFIVFLAKINQLIESLGSYNGGKPVPNNLNMVKKDYISFFQTEIEVRHFQLIIENDTQGVINQEAYWQSSEYTSERYNDWYYIKDTQLEADSFFRKYKDIKLVDMTKKLSINIEGDFLLKTN